MIKLDITKYTFFGIILLSLLIFLLGIMIFVAFIYHTKRKFDSILEYNKLISTKNNSYKQNKNKYYKNLKDSGIISKNEMKVILKIAKIINKFK